MITGFDDTVTCLMMNGSNWKRIQESLCKEKDEYSIYAKREMLFFVKKILDDVGVKFWLSNGTALGMIREGEFIKWDDDIDIDLYAEEYVPVFGEILGRIINGGYIVRPCYRGNTSKMSIFKDDGENIKIALGAVYLDGNSRRKLMRTYPKSFYEDFIWHTYQGVSFRIPGPPEDYLTYIYKDWKTPLKTDYVQSSLLKNQLPSKYLGDK